jgi:hypothetical protein
MLGRDPARRKAAAVNNEPAMSRAASGGRIVDPVTEEDF